MQFSVDLLELFVELLFVFASGCHIVLPVSFLLVLFSYLGIQKLYIDFSFIGDHIVQIRKRIMMSVHEIKICLIMVKQRIVTHAN